MSNELLAAFTDWLDACDAPDATEFVSHADAFLRWRANAPLESLNDDDVITFLLDSSTDARTRLVGLRLLGMFDTDVAEPYMRQLLDTAAAGHAAIWLIDHGLADGDSVGAFITPAIMVDILSQLIDHPDLLCEQFIGGHDPCRMLEFFWRHPAPETAAVLDVLGRHLPDPTLAKQARKAGIKHRSWLANENRS